MKKELAERLASVICNRLFRDAVFNGVTGQFDIGCCHTIMFAKDVIVQSLTEHGKRSPISKKLRFQILTRDNFTCRYCKKTDNPSPLHVDHLIPVRDGGKTVPRNLVTACEDCNLGKGATRLRKKNKKRITQ